MAGWTEVDTGRRLNEGPPTIGGVATKGGDEFESDRERREREGVVHFHTHAA